MSHSPVHPQIACRRDPERWFDRRRRVDALVECLQCPVRSWCAREALKCQASWGVWAGVWIDGHHHDAAPYLEAIAQNLRLADGGETEPTEPRPPLDDDTNGHQPLAYTPLARPAAPIASRSTATRVLARSSGSCEVFTEGCHYTFDRLVSRCPTRDLTENLSPTEVFAACVACADTISCMEPRLAQRSGYVIDAHRDPALMPFHWRASRWVLFERDGWLTEIRTDVQTA